MNKESLKQAIAHKVHRIESTLLSAEYREFEREYSEGELLVQWELLDAVVKELDKYMAAVSTDGFEIRYGHNRTGQRVRLEAKNNS
jgi:hypothetical protein